MVNIPWTLKLWLFLEKKVIFFNLLEIPEVV